jgi:hypothetical protein
MAHSASGNATWVDYPSTSTLITATALENIEGRLDTDKTALTSNVGAGRTVRPGVIGAFDAPFSSANITWTTIPCDQFKYNPDAWYDITNKFWKPQIQGWYWALAWAGQGWRTTGDVAVRINGSNAVNYVFDGPVGTAASVSRLLATRSIFCNGSTDKIAGQVFQGSGATQNWEKGGFEAWLMVAT